MWSSGSVVITLTEVDQTLVFLEVDCPAGKLEIMGEYSYIGSTFRLDGAHIDGLQPGALGRAGLNAIAEKARVDLNVSRIVVQGSVRSTGRNAGRAPKPFHYPR